MEKQKLIFFKHLQDYISVVDYAGDRPLLTQKGCHAYNEVIYGKMLFFYRKMISIMYCKEILYIL